ncbi:MAG: Mor transcription activator family protein [Christensenella sp.]
MNELLDMLELDDLKGAARELADVIGLESFKKLVTVYSGSDGIYIPKVNSIVEPIRNSLIRREFNGYNAYDLARKWDLTERHIREIAKEEIKEIKLKPVDGQISWI